MKLKVFNKLGTGYFFVEVKSTRDIEVVAEKGFKFEYIQFTQYKILKGQQSFPSRLIHYLDSKYYKRRLK